MLTVTLYLFAAAFYISYFFQKKRKIAMGGLGFTGAAFLSHTIWLVHWTAPLFTMAGAIAVVLWFLILIYFIIELQYHSAILGSVLIPPVAVLMFISLHLYEPISREVINSMKTQTNWGWDLTIHIVSCLIGYALFFAVGIFGVLYILVEYMIKKKKINFFFYRMPGLTEIKGFIKKLGLIGFVFLTIGILLGKHALVSRPALEFDESPKMLFSIITWFIYLILNLAVFFPKWHGKKEAWLSIIGMIITMFTFMGINVIFPGLHRFH